MRYRSRLWPIYFFLAILSWTKTATAADTTTVFPTSQDTFDAAFPPYLAVKGDNVTGNRTTSEAQIQAVSYDITFNSSFVFCPSTTYGPELIQVELVLDNTVVATFTMTAFKEVDRFQGTGVPVSKTGTSHTLKLNRKTAFIDDCGSPEVKLDVSTVTLHAQPVNSNDLDGDGYSPPQDCNDNDATVNPGAVEVCDGRDNDCDSQIDEGVPKTLFFQDNDGDTYGNNAATTQACTRPSGYTSVGGDCNDNDANINPGASEICDSKDNDCDAQIDEGVKITYYRDADNDGYGTSATTTQACTKPVGYVTNSTDCDDTNNAINPAATEICDAKDNDCDAQIDEGVKNTYYQDADADTWGGTTTTQACSRPTGYTNQSGDCNDADPNSYPGATETCDGKDNDCDGTADDGLATTTYYRDGDGDTYGAASQTTAACARPTGYVTNSTDCNDADAAINPAATEVCDGKDNDCDAQTDEGVKTTFYGDADNDGYGVSGTTTQACSKPSGYAAQSGDCNDSRNDVYPGAIEACDGVDNDCDSQIDENGISTWYRDADGDNYGAASPTQQACSKPTGYVAQSGDCDDTRANVYPNATEACDGIDNDCDSQIDEVGVTTWYKDADGDGYGISATTTQACSKPTGYASQPGDCDDTRASVNPGATEVCDGLDNDCDTQIDENLKQTYYTDSDGDGYGVVNQSQQACSKPTGYASQSGDCDDTRANVNPGATETCDGLDNDCDSQIDENLKTTWYRDADNDTWGVTSDTTQACSAPTGYTNRSGDCNDFNPDVNPGAVEVCDAVDNDCDSQIDEGLKTTWYKDNDGDGYGGTTTTTQACSAPTGYVADNTDCNDNNAAVKPGATEVCDNLDNNCNGTKDEGVQSTFYNDNDKDTYGNPNVSTRACAAPTGFVTDNTDCNDTRADINPGEEDICQDGIDQDCNGQDKQCGTQDQDGDGQAPVDGDCDDTNNTIFDGAEEEPYDGVDQDCDGRDLTDVDGDGFDSDLVEGGSDCDDDDDAIHPDAEEICDGIDNDCDEAVDNRDADGDGVYDQACGGADCDDTRPSVSPLATEVEDGLDNDCNGLTDDLPPPPTPTPEPDTDTPEEVTDTPDADTDTPPVGETDTPDDSPTTPEGGETDTPEGGETDTPEGSETPTPDVATSPDEGSPTEPPTEGESGSPTDGAGTQEPEETSPGSTPIGPEDEDCGCNQRDPGKLPVSALLVLAALSLRMRRRTSL